MVKIITGLIINPEFESLQRKLEELSERYAKALADYTEYTTTVRRNLETQYLTLIGKMEHQLFSLQIRILRYKREISLIQAAANRGESLSKDELERTIKAEFEEYQRKLEEQQKQIQRAQEHILAPKLSAQENKQVVELYHQLVKKLHPDLHPELYPQASVIWQRVVSAYADGEWQELLILGDLVEQFLQGAKVEAPALDTMEKLQARIQQLEDKLVNLAVKREELAAKPPYCHQKLLEDSAAVMARREELNRQIAEAETVCEQLQKLRVILGLDL